MSFGLIVEPEAEAEIGEAADWYDERAPALRTRFLQAVDAAFQTIISNPGQYQTVFRGLHRALVRNFPYAVVYVVAENVVIVVACLHTSRNPRRWQSRSR